MSVVTELFQPHCFTVLIPLIHLYWRLFPAALVFLILIALSNYTMIFFSCWGLHTYGPWLSKYHKVDLWLHRVLVRVSKLMFRFITTTNTNHFLAFVICCAALTAGSEWHCHIRNMDNCCIHGQLGHCAHVRCKDVPNTELHHLTGHSGWNFDSVVSVKTQPGMLFYWIHSFVGWLCWISQVYPGEHGAG